MMLLLESALRSLLLGLLVRALLQLLRIRDPASETIIWTGMLIAALSMPLLSSDLPALMIAVPHLWAAASAAVGRHLAVSDQASAPLAWLGHLGQKLLLLIYLAGLLVCLIRRIVGLNLTVRLYRRATPVTAAWARGRHIRASAALKSPASLAGVILLPTDHAAWSTLKREAVLAHEQAHIARGDFFVQLAASMHCAVFWFSPFAWWLQAKLAAIAETASDAAAVRHLNDPVAYAEILLEVARGARPSPVIVGMARGALIQQRIERILAEAPSRNLNLPLRVLVVAALTLTALTVARARVLPEANSSRTGAGRPAIAEARHSLPSASTPLDSTAGSGLAHTHAIRPAPRARRSVAAPQGSDAASYNPRALLEAVHSPRHAYVPASTIVHAGKIFYIRSTEEAVADIFAGDGIFRPAQ